MYNSFAKLLLWMLAAFILGAVVGWLIWGRRHDRISQRVALEAETQRLMDRVANLEPVVAERDQLRGELVDCRESLKSNVYLSRLVGHHEDTIRELRGLMAGWASAHPGVSAQLFNAAPSLDLDAGEATIGCKLRADDLKVVEGVGPKIEAMLNGIGISTWGALASISEDTLRAMLNSAGSRFQMHDPSTWPQQARLLADGRWDEFKSMTDALDGGRTPSSLSTSPTMPE